MTANNERSFVLNLDFFSYIIYFTYIMSSAFSGHYSITFTRKYVFFCLKKTTSSLTFLNIVLLKVGILTVIHQIYISSSVNITFILYRLFQFFVLNDSVLISLVELSLEVRFRFTRVLKITGCGSVRNFHVHVKTS